MSLLTAFPRNASLIDVQIDIRPAATRPFPYVRVTVSYGRVTVTGLLPPVWLARLGRERLLYVLVTVTALLPAWLPVVRMTMTLNVA
jgi:hypothetical protein